MAVLEQTKADTTGDTTLYVVNVNHDDEGVYALWFDRRTYADQLDQLLTKYPPTSPIPMHIEIAGYRSIGDLFHVLWDRSGERALKSLSGEIRRLIQHAGSAQYIPFYGTPAEDGYPGFAEDAFGVDEARQGTCETFNNPRQAGERQAFPPELKDQVWLKTNGHCAYCGLPLLPFTNFTIDHVHPFSDGGADTYDNLVPCCKSCNSHKHAMPVETYRIRRGGGPFWIEKNGGSL